MVNKITFKNYKLFKEKQELELKPITILIGKNNSGKSAVLKLPTIISRSLKGDFVQPIEMDNNGVKVGLSYEDLFYNRSLTNDALEIGVADENEKLEIAIAGNMKNEIYISQYKFNDIDYPVNKTNLTGGFKNKKAKYKTLKLNFDYIDSFRKFPSAQFSDIHSEYSNIGTSGESAYKLLAQYHNTSNTILTEIKKWFKENFEGWKLDVKDISSTIPSYEIILSTDKISPINIVNTGSGIRQALPLIVRSFMPVNEETLIIIEEPETHLHPAAHGNLAERFVNSYLDDNKRKYFIETHSKNFILRIQRLIASGNINFTDIKIYYVDYNEDEFASSLFDIKIDEDGEIDNWPDNVFNESLDEVINLRRAQKQKQNASKTT